MSDVTSATLLVSIRDHQDQAAWTRFWSIYEPFLQRMLTAQGLLPQDIDDVVQEVMQAVSGSIGTFQHNGRVGAFRHWLRQTAAYRLREAWRRNKRGGAQEASDVALAEQLADPQSALSRLWDTEHDRLVVQRLLAIVQNEFPPHVFAAFQLTFFKDYSLSAAGAELSLAPNTVAVAKSRVLARLRELGEGLIDL